MCLETERIRLREFSEGDEDLLYSLDSDPEVMRHLTNGVPTTREGAKAALGRILTMTRKYEGKFGFWAAIEKQSDQFIGWFHFRPAKDDIENLSRIEFGYRLKQLAWGKGYATEVSKSLIQKGFNELDVVEVFALTKKENVASQRVMEKAGLSFKREFEEIRSDGAKSRTVEFCLSK